MSKIVPIKEQLITLCKALGLSMRAFSISLGKDPSWLKGITKDVGSSVIGKILLIYPEVNIRWLLLGEGDIFIKSENNPLISSEEDSDLKKKVAKQENEISELIKKVGSIEGKLESLSPEVDKGKAI